MKKRIKVLYLILLIFSFGIYLGRDNFFSKNSIETKNQENISFFNIDFDKVVFYKAIDSVNEQSSFDEKIRGGIVPHDLLAGNFVASFFYRLSFQKPETIVLIGPNHFEKGEGNFITSKFGYDSFFGKLLPDLELINKLDLSVIGEVINQDHSIIGIIPFIKYYLKDTKIVPIVVSKKAKISDIDNFVNKFSEVTKNKSVVFVASVDFSHYLSSKESDKKDEISLEAIKSLNYERIIQFDNDYMDSPASVVCLLKLVEKDNNLNFEVLDHSNSGEILGNPYIENTSYFSMAFYR